MPATTKVLILDDDLDSRVEARKALQRARLELAGEVGFGTEALIVATETRPDVILIAVEEPVTRPLETAERLANVLPRTPVIFYSSLNDPDAVRRAVHFGARDYLVKPLQASAVAQAIARALEYEEKRQMRQAGQLSSPTVRGTVITVAGAKGGIGKSIIAVNLALALRERTHGKVAIIDGDTQFGDVATMFDVTPARALEDLIRDLDRLDRNSILEYLTMFGDKLSIVPGPTVQNAWDDAGPEAARKVVELLAQTHDFVVVDTSGAVDRFVRAFIDSSTLVLMVTTGEVSSVRDTKAALARLEGWEVPPDKVKVVLNRGARAEGFRVTDLEQSLARPVFWELPKDNRVGRSVQVGRPVVIDSPNATASKHIMALAAAIGGNAVENGVHGPVSAGLIGLLKGREAKKVAS
ncbi:MAG TPA: response regulator [Dehalococcoidia bacterium]|nr:response regulator [Dehalococcoidia bacterium]